MVKDDVEDRIYFIYAISTLDESDLKKQLSKTYALHVNIDHMTGHTGVCRLNTLVEDLPLDHTAHDSLSAILREYPFAVSLNDDIIFMPLDDEKTYRFGM